MQQLCTCYEWCTSIFIRTCYYASASSWHQNNALWNYSQLRATVSSALLHHVHRLLFLTATIKWTTTLLWYFISFYFILCFFFFSLFFLFGKSVLDMYVQTTQGNSSLGFSLLRVPLKPFSGDCKGGFSMLRQNSVSHYICWNPFNTKSLGPHG